MLFKLLFSAKVSSISQSGSLSLFSSKEQELEQRALLLKRLAFVIFCSEVDQYQKHMPDIQGKNINLFYQIIGYNRFYAHNYVGNLDFVYRFFFVIRSIGAARALIVSSVSN